MRRLFASAAFLLVLSVVPHAQESRTVQGSRVTMQVPLQYESATQFPGFVNRSRKASVLVADLPPAAYAEVASGFTAEALATRGVRLDTIGKLDGRTDEHVYLTGSQATTDGIYGKYMLLIRSERATAMITASVAKTSLDTGSVSVGEIEAILRSATVGLEPAASPPVFTLRYLGRLKDSGTFLAPMRGYTREGTFDPGRPVPGRTMFVVAPPLDNTRIPDVAAYAEARLRGTELWQVTNVTARRPVVIAGLKGFEHEASAVTGTERIPIVVYQTVLARPAGGAFVMIGQALATEGKEMLPEFAKMARSFVPAAR